MNELTTEKTVTTKELANSLGVDISTIKKTVKRLEEGGEVLHHSTTVKGNTVFYYTEKQATIIKQEIQKHHNLQSRQIDSVSTDYEMELLTQKVIAYHIQKANEYKQRAEIAESALNRIANSEETYSVNDTAKILKLPYGDRTLYKNLISMKILNENKSPRQDQINAGRFVRDVSWVQNLQANVPVTRVTGKGLVYLAKKFNTEIDETILNSVNKTTA